MSLLQSVKYSRGSLEVLDQLKLPLATEYITVNNSNEAWTVIRQMNVRGAPLIAIVAALGLGVEAHYQRGNLKTAADAQALLIEKMEYLRTSRPTAVNLFTATDALKKTVEALASKDGASVDSVVDGYIAAAEKYYADDLAMNMSIGKNGMDKILSICKRDKVRVLTICNTGSLATAGYGTALGVVRSLHNAGKLEHVYACETRPYNQGARLTAYEIVTEKFPGTLICDSMASSLMATKGIDCVIVGADRVAANGDTANKIGTYQLAITAKHHGVPFFTALTTTSVDLSIASGALIPVEERPAGELTTMFGQRIAPEGINAWNPGFDVTPSSLIRGIITEVGVAEASVSGGAIIDMPAFFQEKGQVVEGAAIPTDMPTNYTRFDEKAIGEYALGLPAARAFLEIGSSADDLASLKVTEVGDGNLNYVFIVMAPSGKGIVIKQALPYVRCVGESWPLTLERATFEHNALEAEAALCPDHVPAIMHFDKRNALIVMRYIEPPHIILRKSLIAGERVSSFAAHVGAFCARTLYGTSALALTGGVLRTKIAEWSRNKEMCALTEQVIFTDPYYESPINHWTAPQLDLYAAGIRNDTDLKLAAQFLKGKFLNSTQALLHADLHTGSVMVKQDSTFCIDPEFAFYGPMGFDTGAFLANMLLSYFSHAANKGDEYAEWVLEQTIIYYETFETLFLQLWNEAHAAGKVGDLYPTNQFQGDVLVAAQKSYMAELWRDTRGFAGMKMIRRIVGIAHVADLDSIEDTDGRSQCEKRALLFARRLVLSSAPSAPAEKATTIRLLAEEARAMYKSSPGDSWAV